MTSSGSRTSSWGSAFMELCEEFAWASSVRTLMTNEGVHTCPKLGCKFLWKLTTPDGFPVLCWQINCWCCGGGGLWGDHYSGLHIWHPLAHVAVWIDSGFPSLQPVPGTPVPAPAWSSTVLLLSLLHLVWICDCVQNYVMENSRL